MKINPIAKTLRKVAPRIGAKVIMEPKWGKVGQIVFKSGRKRYFRYATLDLNHIGSSDIARDKDYAKFFMDRMGYPTIRGKAFCSEKWASQIDSSESTAAAYRFCKKLGWPVVVKPNSKSQGRCVFVVRTRREFENAFREVSKIDSMILVEQLVSGHDYRVVVLDGRVVSAYERIPLSVVGDGRTSILNLLKHKQKMFKHTGRDTVLKLDDRRIVHKLRRQHLSFSSCPSDGQVVYLLDNANLSTGGDSKDVTNTIHPAFQKLAVDVTRDMGLRLCGVDLMVDGDITSAPKKGAYWIIEINSAPGFDHYASSGKTQMRIIEDLHLEVLKAMDTDV
ncbi:MAG: cyanophycin synthetase [Patescibacteria group bacterium]|nr:cyanophycin synthetase [Patescibacteria group bacterium]